MNIIPILVNDWLTRPVGQVPILPDEMDRLKQRMAGDPRTKQSWADNCAVADQFLAEKPGPLTPTPLSEYNSNNSMATVNNNRGLRFVAGWEACAWKAALAGDGICLQRAHDCLDMILRVHKEKGGVRVGADPKSAPGIYYYHLNCSFRPAHMIGLVELMRLAGWNDRELLERLIERLLFMAETARKACEYLQANKPYRNWDACGGAALLAIAAALPKHPDAKEWERLGRRNVAEFFGPPHILPDGTFYEAFPSAEEYGLQFLFNALQVLRGFKNMDMATLRLSPTRTLRESLLWHLKVASPLGEFPCINDANAYEAGMGEGNQSGAHLYVLCDWLGLDEAWETFCAADYRLPLFVHACRMPDKKPPGRPSEILRDVGWTFLRSGSGRNRFQVMWDHGIHPAGHPMPQCLTFDLACDGRHWLVNSGTTPHYCTYREQLTWHRRTKAGNCIVIDDEDIPPGTNGELLQWRKTPAGIRAQARHTGYKTVIHTRTLIYHEPNVLLVIDDLTPTDGKPHAAEMFWHIYGVPFLKKDRNWIFTSGRDDDRALIMLSSELTAKTTISKGLCGGLGGGNRLCGRLPPLESLRPGDPGWIWTPCLQMPVKVPAEGKSIVTVLVPINTGRNADWQLIPEYCALFAQYSLFANDGKALAKRRRVKRITQLVIRLTQVVNPLSASIYAG